MKKYAVFTLEKLINEVGFSNASTTVNGYKSIFFILLYAADNLSQGFIIGGI